MDRHHQNPIPVRRDGVFVPVLAAIGLFWGPAPQAKAAPEGFPETPGIVGLPAVSTASAPVASSSSLPSAYQEVSSSPIVFPANFQPMRAVHLTAWAAGSPRARGKFLDSLAGTVVNAVVIPIKEIDGRVYISGVEKAVLYGTVRIAIPRPEELLADLKRRGLKAVARVAVFKDDTLARKKPEWAVRRPDGGLWKNYNGVTWADPYRREIWEYVVDVAAAAARLGFDEIQFDYVRFPSDGDTRLCRYSRADHGREAAVENLREFLRYARRRLAPFNARVSAAVFGLTTTAKNDMGIGQELSAIAELVDFVSPMMYPSHYAKGEYGLRDPNREPYKIVKWGLRDAKERLKASSYKLRPYLQDFSLGYHYGPPQVRAELAAAKAQGVESWILWNPANHYTWSALKPERGAQTP